MASPRAVLAIVSWSVLGCVDKKPETEPTPTGTISPMSVTPPTDSGGRRSAVDAATEVSPAALNRTLTGAQEIFEKYDPAIRELIEEAQAKIAEEKRRQEDGGRKPTRIPFPATKLAKDPSVLQIAIPNTRIVGIDMQPLNPKALRAGTGKLGLKAKSGTRAVTCPSEYTNEPAVDLDYEEPFFLTVTVKSEACREIVGDRDAEIAKVKKIAESGIKAYADHAAKTPPKCEAPHDAEPEIGDALRKLGVSRARIECRRPDQASFQAYAARDGRGSPAKTRKSPAWRTAVPGLPHAAFYLSEDAATGKLYMLTLTGLRADNVEVNVEFSLE